MPELPEVETVARDLRPRLVGATVVGARTSWARTVRTHDPVTFGAAGTISVIDRSPDVDISMRWIQPILGQAIVEDALIRQRSNDATSPSRFLEGSSKPSAGSVQWVLGRVIVELSRSRMVGGLPAGGREKDDQRIVTIARHAAEQFL